MNDARNYHEQIIYVQIKESYFQQHHLDLYYRDYIKEVQITEPCGTPAYTLRLDDNKSLCISLRITFCDQLL